MNLPLSVHIFPNLCYAWIELVQTFCCEFEMEKLSDGEKRVVLKYELYCIRVYFTYTEVIADFLNVLLHLLYLSLMWSVPIIRVQIVFFFWTFLTRQIDIFGSSGWRPKENLCITCMDWTHSRIGCSFSVGIFIHCGRSYICIPVFLRMKKQF